VPDPRAARGPRSAAEIAQLSGISLDTLRKIERSAISSPTFFTVAALARVLDLDLATLARTLMPEETAQHHQAAS
jgi:transcriptional regulator with XRE-family HTH domain